MRALSIQSGDNESMLDLSNITLLIGNSAFWYELVEAVKDFFNNRSTEVVLKLDGNSINKKDWECLFLSASNFVSFDDKVTLKSPVYAELLNLLSDNIDSPEYIQLQNAWLDLTDVLSQAFQQQMSDLKLDLELVVNELPINALASNLGIKPTKAMSYFDLRLTLLKWFTQKPQTKFRLIVFEYPELYSNQAQLEELNSFVNKLSQATYFIAVTNHNFTFGSRNILLNNIVVNRYYINMMYDTVQNKMPFVMVQEDFALAVDVLLKALNTDDLYKSINALPLKSIYIATEICFILRANIDVKRIDSREVQIFFENC